MKALDTVMNPVYGLLVTFWASFFVESWKRKQKMIQFYWGCSDSSFSKVDERTEQFRYYKVYNKKTDRVEKIKQTMKQRKQWTYRILSYFFLGIVLGSMVVYLTLNFATKPQYDANGKIVVE